MKPAPFAYLRAQTVAEACAALANPEHGVAVAIAGGQSLMPLLALRLTPADLVVDIGRLAELKATTAVGDGVQIGAGVTHADLEDGRVVDPSGGLMRRVAATIGYRAVRNHGTLGGSVALADPAADWPACLLALGAHVRLAGPTGERSASLDDILIGAYTTSLRPGELITAFDVAAQPKAVRVGYAKVVRKSGAFATSIGCVVDPGPDGAPRVVVGGTTTRPHLLPRVAGCLGPSKTPDEAALRAAIAQDLAVLEPDADAYQQRVHTATVLRAIKEARS